MSSSRFEGTDVYALAIAEADAKDRSDFAPYNKESNTKAPRRIRKGHIVLEDN